MSSGFLLLPASHYGSGLTFLVCIGWTLIRFCEHCLSVVLEVLLSTLQRIVELSKSSSHRFDDSVTAVLIPLFDQSARYSTLFHC